MNKLSRLTLLSLLSIVCGATTVFADDDITGTWDYGNADIMAATMALSGSTEAGQIEAIEQNGLKMTVEANGASFRNNGNNIQVRSGAVFKIPVKNAGDLITVKGYTDYSYYTIGSSTQELKNENTYTAKASDAQAGFVAVTSTNDNNYYLSLSVTQYAPKGNGYILECQLFSEQQGKRRQQLYY